jgi:hypothetical protein
MHLTTAVGENPSVKCTKPGHTGARLWLISHLRGRGRKNIAWASRGLVSRINTLRPGKMAH